jgi:hypothetical protein
MYVVDHLLDILTGNEHRKTSKYIEEMKNLRKGKNIIFCQNQFSSTLKQGLNELLAASSLISH